jgi:hypothetical protein
MPVSQPDVPYHGGPALLAQLTPLDYTVIQPRDYAHWVTLAPPDAG